MVRGQIHWFKMFSRVHWASYAGTAQHIFQYNIGSPVDSPFLFTAVFPRAPQFKK